MCGLTQPPVRARDSLRERAVGSWKMHSDLGIDLLRDRIDRTGQHAEFTIVAELNCVIVKATMLPGTGHIGLSCWRGRWRSYGIGHAPFARDTGLRFHRRRHLGPTERLLWDRSGIAKRRQSGPNVVKLLKTSAFGLMTGIARARWTTESTYNFFRYYNEVYICTQKTYAQRRRDYVPARRLPVDSARDE